MKLEKITTESGRWYDDACGTAHALELVGERWSLLIMRELMFGPRRFSDLKASLPGVSANVLTQRLERLEGAGILVNASRGVMYAPAEDGRWADASRRAAEALRDQINEARAR